jgi:hypothetical protein
MPACTSEPRCASTWPFAADMCAYTQPLGELAALSPTHDIELIPPTDHLFAGKVPGSTRWTWFYFSSLPEGTPYLHDGARATPMLS